ncbi:MAG: hypothetical protein ACTSUK_05660 [Promethearchaeota archaeon]
MKCKCGKKMKYIYGWDDAQETDHAYNLYACEYCGLLLKEDVWNDRGLRWIFLDGEMFLEDSE